MALLTSPLQSWRATIHSSWFLPVTSMSWDKNTNKCNQTLADTTKHQLSHYYILRLCNILMSSRLIVKSCLLDRNYIDSCETKINSNKYWFILRWKCESNCCEWRTTLTDSLVIRSLHTESNIFVFVILSYQNACYGWENAENRTWSEYIYFFCP